MDNKCICCGEIIPEGRQVCWKCEHKEVNNKERENSKNEQATKKNTNNRAKEVDERKWIYGKADG